MRITDKFPSEDGYYMPAEYAHHDACIMIWPQRPGSFKEGCKAAREAFSKVARAISMSEKVYMFSGHEAIDSARTAFENESNIIVIEVETNDAWARDTGATFVIKKNKNSTEKRVGELEKSKLSLRCGVDWKFNAWGGDYNGLYKDYNLDQQVAERICEVVESDIFDATHFVLEGGAIHVDGEGTLITTEECLLSKGRNPELSKSQIEDNLKKYLGVNKVIFLPQGIYNDETDGHVDNFCCFSAPGEVLLAWTEDKDDPQYERSHKAFEILSNEKDACGRDFIIRLLPIPKESVCITESDLEGYIFEDGEEQRQVGERLAASYVNFYISNKSVVYPCFGGTNEASDKEARMILKKAFPDRDIIGIYARDILVGGGNIHCITQQIPSIEMQ